MKIKAGLSRDKAGLFSLKGRLLKIKGSRAILSLPPKKFISSAYEIKFVFNQTPHVPSSQRPIKQVGDCKIGMKIIL